MKGILTRNIDGINAVSHANVYAEGLIHTDGKKTCTNLGLTIGKTHDVVQRVLDAVADSPEEIRAHLINSAIEKNKVKKGFLIKDSTVLVKEWAKIMEGVSRQRSGSKIQPGINMTGFVWTDLEEVAPVDLFSWKKGDPSKIETATDQAISLAQRIGVKAVLADAAYASIKA